MSNKVILTCAVTGAGDTGLKYPAVPVTPAQIADASIEACRAGAAIAHIHVRDPKTGKPSMDVALYREVVERIRDSGCDVVINLTTGPGARFVPSDTMRNTAADGSNLRPPLERVTHIIELKPDICSLDMGSLNFGSGTLINVPRHVEVMAEAIRKAGVMPELEVFDTGHIALALDMMKRGLLDKSSLFQAVLGAPWSAPATPETMMLIKQLMPPGTPWAAFGVGRWQFPMLAQALLLGGHVRVGLEDNLYLEKGVLAPSNAALVECGVKIMRSLGFEPATPTEARRILRIGTPATI